MIAADLPPSSSETGRSSRPHTSAICRPAAVEPVKATLSTSRCCTRYAPISRPPGTMLTTPGGRPAASTASANTYESSTVSGDGLSTIVLPAASAGAYLNEDRVCG